MPSTPSPGPAAALDLAEALVRAAVRSGADAADVMTYRTAALSANWRLGRLEDVERAEAGDLGLRVMIGKRQAIVASNDLSERGTEGLVERAIAMAKAAPEDPYCGLAPEDRLARTLPDLDLDDGEEPATEKLLAWAQEAEDAARAVEGVTNSNGASAGWQRGQIYLVTSAGFAQGYGVSNHSVSCSVLAGEGTGMETDYDFSSARHLRDVRTAADVGREAAARAVRRLGSRKAPSRKMPVVYDRRVSRTLLSHFAGAISGPAIARGTSFLKDALDTEVFGKSITIVDDPHRRRGLASRPFDGEGVATARVAVAEDGRLTTWLLDSASARQLGLQTTGHAARGTGGPPHPSTSNLYMAPGSLTPEALIGEIEDGFYVTDLIGMGVNGVTGDYSRGAGGFRIENGKLTHPVNEVTVASNLKEMFRNLTPANDLIFEYGTNAPTLRVDGMTVAGE